MKYCFVLSFLLLAALSATAGTAAPVSEFDQPEQLPKNYQQFKHQFMFHSNMGDQASMPSYRGNDDFTMLYVTGGLVVITGTLAYLNGRSNSNGFFSPDNTGLIVVGSISAGIVLTKFLVDRYRGR